MPDAAAKVRRFVEGMDLVAFLGGGGEGPFDIDVISPLMAWVGRPG